MNARFFRQLIVGVCVLTSSVVGAAELLTPAQFKQARSVICPQPGEDKWEQINWRTNLWEARREAALAGKPILLWEMDGHPLGCV